MTFNEWKEQADMPTLVNGKWVDLETGIAWNNNEAFDKIIKAKNEAAKAARKEAKVLGGKALKGSAAQKKWGEEIRREVLRRISLELAEEVLSNENMQHASFWIERRGKISEKSLRDAIEGFKLAAYYKQLSDLVSALESRVIIAKRRSMLKCVTQQNADKAIKNAKELISKKIVDNEKISEAADMIISVINEM